MSAAITLQRGDPMNTTLTVSHPACQEADVLVDRAEGAALSGFYTVIDGQQVAVGESLSGLLALVVEGAANRGSISVRTMPEEISTTVAAHELGVSRPTLMKMVRAGEIPSRKVGTHTRLRFADVLAVAERRNDEKDRAFARLIEASTALGEK